MFGTVLQAVGGHNSPRSIEATPLYMGLEAHILPAVHAVIRLLDGPYLTFCPCRLSCMCIRPFMLSMVRLRLQAVRKDHFEKVVPDWPSEGPHVVRGSQEHATSADIAFGRSFGATSVYMGPEALKLIAALSVPRQGTTSHALAMQTVLHVLVY